MAIIIHKEINNLEYIHSDAKESLKDIYLDLKVGDAIICDSKVYVAHDEGYGQEYLEIHEWQPLGLSEWVLDGGKHPLVENKGTYATFVNDKDVWLVPNSDGKTNFIDKETGEVLGESDFPCVEFEPLDKSGSGGRHWYLK
jgi:hypothetical protein